MPIPFKMNPMGTLGTQVFNTLHLPIGTSISDIVYESPFNGAVTGKCDVDILTFNNPVTVTGGITFTVGGWGVHGSCMINIRNGGESYNVICAPLVYRSVGTSTLFWLHLPISVTQHIVCLVEQNKCVSIVNGVERVDSSFSAIDATGKDFKISAPNTVNEFDIHSVEFTDGVNTLKFVPACRNGLSGLYELNNKNFHPIHGSTAF